MPSKRQSINETKHPNSSEVKDYNSLILEDALCPICKSIMIDPVSLPCNHNFCLCCFDDTMKNANMVCPLCQVRVGSWWRKAQMEGKHVDRNLQAAINARFSRRVSNKLNGIDENWEAPDPEEIGQECGILSNGGNKLELKVEASEQLESIKEGDILGELPVVSTDLSAPQLELPLENSQDATLQVKEPCEQSNDISAAEQFTCRTVPMSIAVSAERDRSPSPMSVVASNMEASKELMKSKEYEDYKKEVQAEKVRLQKQFEDRLASGKLFVWPPPDSIYIQFRNVGKKVEEPVEVPYCEPEVIDFATKDFTSRELILNRVDPPIPKPKRKRKEKTNSNNKTRPTKKLSTGDRFMDNIEDNIASIKAKIKAHKYTYSGISPRDTPSCSSATEAPKAAPVDTVFSLRRTSSGSFGSDDFFRGFEASDEENDSGGPFEGPSKRRKLEEVVEVEQKALQEQLDLQFAWDLQQSLNRAHYTRRPLFRLDR